MPAYVLICRSYTYTLEIVRCFEPPCIRICHKLRVTPTNQRYLSLFGCAFAGSRLHYRQSKDNLFLTSGKVTFVLLGMAKTKANSSKILSE